MDCRLAPGRFVVVVEAILLLVLITALMADAEGRGDARGDRPWATYYDER